MIRAICALILATLCCAAPARADHLPRPDGHVNDFAQVLDPSDESQLESTLRDYERSSGNEIAIALVEDLDGGDIDDFTVRAFEEWKPGKTDRDNGVLILAAIEDRKVRIEVGYGVEGDLTDGEAGNVVRNAILPEFRQQNYAGGLTAAVESIRTELGGQQSEHAQRDQPDDSWSAWPFVLGFFFLNWIAAFLGRTKSIWAGTLLGALAGVMGAIVLGLGFAGAAALVAAVTGAGAGFDALLSRNYRKNHRRGVRNSWGGFFMGSSGGGGGSSFSGFGGGRSGGGGASGGW